MKNVLKKICSLLLAALILAGMFTLASCDKTEVPEEPAADETADSTDEGTDSSEEDSTDDTSSEETFEQEIFGQGTEEDPYLATPTNMTVKTLPIPAGASSFYAIYRTGGKIFVINDANAYVKCAGITYNAEEGIVTFKIPDALASETVLFEIGNNGDTDAEFEIKFSDVPGSLESPITVDTLDGDKTVSIPEGTTQGYYYIYTAEKAGTIRFYMTASVEAGMTIDRIRNENEVVQVTMDGETTDEAGNPYVEIEVNEGDELRINLSAIPNKRGKYPAVDITWSAKYN